MKQTGAVGRREKQMQILKEKIVRYETDGSIVKGYDAGELIRCRDCQHWYEEDHVCGLRDCYGWDYKPDSFCSWAERKEE